MFDSRNTGIEVDNVAIGGTTAAFWSRMPNSLADAVSDNPDAQWVWLSLGGNDGIFGLAMGREMEDIIEQAVNDTKVILDALFRTHPNIKVVQFGYDVVNFDMSVFCRTLGRTLFPECRGSISCSNEEMYNLQYTVDLISQFYSGHTSVNLLGTMQRASGEVQPPYPNDNFYTPGYLMRDCIHPTGEGFTFLFDQLWEVYFKDEVAAYKKMKNEK